jgi:hypothetical protein
MINKIDKKDLSDLDFGNLPPGFSIIFDKGKPVGAIAAYKYYQYISKLIGKVKEYVEHVNKHKQQDET